MKEGFHAERTKHAKVRKWEKHCTLGELNNGKCAGNLEYERGRGVQEGKHHTGLYILLKGARLHPRSIGQSLKDFKRDAKRL